MDFDDAVDHTVFVQGDDTIEGEEEKEEGKGEATIGADELGWVADIAVAADEVGWGHGMRGVKFNWINYKAMSDGTSWALLKVERETKGGE